MSIASIRARLKALATRIPPTAAPVVAKDASEDREDPRLPIEVERALVNEIFRHRDALTAAAAGLPHIPADPWRWGEDHFAEMDRAGRLDPCLVREIIGLGRVFDAGPSGLIVIRPAGGPLARGDARKVLAARRENRPFVILPAAPPIGGLGIDVKAEMMAFASTPERGGAACN
jgi:hypothetical protein